VSNGKGSSHANKLVVTLCSVHMTTVCAGLDMGSSWSSSVVLTTGGRIGVA
jgi:hypothetical protein